MAERASRILKAQARQLKLESFKIAAHELAMGLYQGQHRAQRKGAGIEFAGHRSYTPGDDLRRLDHHALAKFDQLLIREFQSETDRAAHFVVDTSASMHYQGAGEKKLKRAVLLAAALGLILKRQGDPIGLTLLGSNKTSFLPSAKERVEERFLTQLAESVAADNPQNQSEPALLTATQRLLGERLPRGALTFYLSDCLDPISDTLQLLAPLKTRGRSVFVIQVLDAHEIEFPFSTPAYFVDPKRGTSTLSDPRQVRKTYRERFTAHQVSLGKALAQREIRLSTLRVDEPARDGLMKLLRLLGSVKL